MLRKPIDVNFVFHTAFLLGIKFIFKVKKDMYLHINHFIWTSVNIQVYIKKSE